METTAKKSYVVNVDLSLSGEDAVWLQSYLQNQHISGESEECAEIRGRIFNALHHLDLHEMNIKQHAIV